LLLKRRAASQFEMPGRYNRRWRLLLVDVSLTFTHTTGAALTSGPGGYNPQGSIHKTDHSSSSQGSSAVFHRKGVLILVNSWTEFHVESVHLK
jgi:hypothetical protein